MYGMQPSPSYYVRVHTNNLIMFFLNPFHFFRPEAKVSFYDISCFPSSRIFFDPSSFIPNLPNEVLKTSLLFFS